MAYGALSCRYRCQRSRPPGRIIGTGDLFGLVTGYPAKAPGHALARYPPALRAAGGGS